MGYSPTQKGYQCYSPITKKFYYSLNVTFFEEKPYFTKTIIQGESPNLEYQFWCDQETTKSTIPNFSPTKTLAPTTQSYISLNPNFNPTKTLAPTT